MPMVRITPPPLSSQAMADLLCTVMLLWRGRDSGGKPCWAYMCIKPSMAQAFRDACKRGNFELEDYGTVIESGSGEEAPVEVRARMEREYGMNHGYEDRLLQAIEAVT